MDKKVNLKNYLAKKSQRLVKESLLPRRKVCLQCLRPPRACFCAQLESFKTQTRFILLMHPKEAKKEKVGTGRLSHICLENSKIIVGESFTNNKEVNHLLADENYAPFVLYPGEESLNLSHGSLDGEYSASDKKLLVFIIDATWSCAKSMMRESSNLHGLKKISFDVRSLSQFTIKHQPDKYCLCTIESIYYLIEELIKGDIEQASVKHSVLLLALSKLNQFQIDCSNDPSLPSYRRGTYKDPSLRKMSLKWIDRKICFDQKNYN